MKKILLIIGCLAFLTGCKNSGTTKIIQSGAVSIVLSVNSDGVPYISKVVSTTTGKTFFCDATHGKMLQARLEKGFLMSEEAKISPLTDWETSEDSLFVKAKASVKVSGAEVSMHVELMKSNSIFSTWYSVSTKNGVSIKTFPIFLSGLQLPDSTKQLTSWKALEFTQQKQIIDTDTRVVLQSRIHSSDNYNGVAGNVPYWTVQNAEGSIGFSLAWCGGWTAELSGENGTLKTDVYLPESETQLTLGLGEEINGPKMIVFFSEESDPVLFRNHWQTARSELAGKLFPQPKIDFPLIYNHWYAVEFDLSETFVKNQVKWFGDYGFDVFMVDAGWYKGIGSWTPNEEKFSPVEFQRSINTIKSSGAVAGLWSCPQLRAANKPLPGYIDQPGTFVPFVNAWLVDYNAMDYGKYLKLHLDTLTNQLGAGWWKFDQEYFTKNPRSGKMKSVTAFQKAYAEARKAYPKLIFEACQGGGKMINEFTDQISQIHWIRDGERTGYIHAVTNIYEALGAVGFLEPQKVQRWNNRIDETALDSPELLKFYCRSCMIGTWGISADLNKISRVQKAIILDEVKNYRRLNEIKSDNLVELTYPGEYTNQVPVVFYDKSMKKAGIIFYRMFPKNQASVLKLKTRLDPTKKYRIENADQQTVQIVSGNVFELTLAPNQLSAVYFISEEN